MSNIHTEHFSIRTSEISHLKVAHPHALIQLMQEASMQHTIHMKVSVWDLENIKSSWVLVRMEVDIFRHPTLNERIKIDTYPSGVDGYFTYRDYYVYDGDQHLIAQATSQWVLMSTDTRKMIKIPETFTSLIHDANIPLQKPGSISNSAHQNVIIKQNRSVNYFHLDWNGHVNNVAMIKMIFESLTTQILYNKRLKKLLIQFKGESTLDQVLSFITLETTADEMLLHKVEDFETERELVLAQTIWENT